MIKVDSITARDFGGTFDSNLTVQADSGFVRFAVIHTSPPDVDSTDFATVWVTVVGAGGDSTEVKWKLDELSDPVQFSDLLPFIVSNQSLKVGVTPGIWGDATKDQLITAVDALVCLSHVVGKTLPESFDPRARDVAPGAGTRFAGKGTALVALAILSWVVGQALPEHFRVGDSRSAVAGGADSLAPPASTRDIRNSQLGACGMVWSGSLGPAVCQKRRAASHPTVYSGYQ